MSTGGHDRLPLLVPWQDLLPDLHSAADCCALRCRCSANMSFLCAVSAACSPGDAPDLLFWRADPLITHAPQSEIKSQIGVRVDRSPRALVVLHAETLCDHAVKGLCGPAGHYLHWNAVVLLHGAPPFPCVSLPSQACGIPQPKAYCLSQWEAQLTCQYASMIMQTVTIIAVCAEHGRLDAQVYASNNSPIGSISAVWNNLNTVANAAPVAGKLCPSSPCDA